MTVEFSYPLHPTSSNVNIFYITIVKRSEVKVTLLCLTPCDLMDYTAHGILQARILERVAFPFSRGIFPTQGSNPGLPHCRQMLY